MWENQDVCFFWRGEEAGCLGSGDLAAGVGVMGMGAECAVKV